MAQLVSALDCRSGGCGFEPRRPRQSEKTSGLPRGVMVAPKILILVVGVRVPARQPLGFQTRRCPSFFISHARAKKPNTQGIFEIRDVSKSCGGQARRGRFRRQNPQNHSCVVVCDTSRNPCFSRVKSCKYEKTTTDCQQPKREVFITFVLGLTHPRRNLATLQ